MMRRVLASMGLAAAVAAIASLPVSGQAPAPGSLAAAAPPLVITAYNGGPEPSNWTPPKTPWGEPDLQGVWSSDDATFGISRGGGRGGGPAPTGLYLNDEQYAARVKQIQQGVVNAEQNATSTFRNDFARRAFRQTSYIIDPPNGVMPQPNAEARTRARIGDRGTFGDGPFNDFDAFTLYDRCITRGTWGSVARVIYGNGNRIVQAPGVVAITYEMIHDTRVIHTDGRPHINDGIRQYLGNSRGWWEGDTLVVETRNLTDQTSIGLNGNGLRHSAQMTMVERIRRVGDDMVQYQLTVNDPVTYPTPFTMSIPLTPLDGGVILPYECHEGNQAVRNSLSGERAEERQMAEDLARGIIRPRRSPNEPATVRRGGEAPGGRGGRGGRGGGAAPAAAPDDGDQER